MCKVQNLFIFNQPDEYVKGEKRSILKNTIKYAVMNCTI
jgi:hypothetical protein